MHVPGDELHGPGAEGIHAVNAASERLPLIDVLDRVLDKGIVISYEMDVAVVGLRIFEFTGHVVIASFETYLHKWQPLAADGEQISALTSAADQYLRDLGSH